MIENIEKLKGYYSILVNNGLPDSEIETRAQLVQILERETGSDFKNTDDFISKMDAYLIRQEYPGAKLSEARKKRGWTQDVLAAHLGLSHQFVSGMENGRKSLTDNALAFIKKQSA